MKRWIAGSHEQLHKWCKFIIHCTLRRAIGKGYTESRPNECQPAMESNFLQNIRNKIMSKRRGNKSESQYYLFDLGVWSACQHSHFVSAKLRRYRKRVKPWIVQCGSWTKEQLSAIVESRCRYCTLKKGRYHDVDFSEETPDISWFIGSSVINSA